MSRRSSKWVRIDRKWYATTRRGWDYNIHPASGGGYTVSAHAHSWKYDDEWINVGSRCRDLASAKRAVDDHVASRPR